MCKAQKKIATYPKEVLSTEEKLSTQPKAVWITEEVRNAAEGRLKHRGHRLSQP